MLARIAVITLAAAPMPALAQRQPDFLPPGITVQGSATIKTPPDVATIKVELRGDGTTADAASRALATTQKAVIGGIATIDPAIDYRTGAISIREVRKGDCANAPSDDFTEAMLRPGVEKESGPCRVVGYVASIEATVEMRATDKVGTAIGLAGRLGAGSAELEGFSLRDPAPAQRAATAAAIADAQARAGTLAAASGTRLGPVVSILGGSDGPMPMLAREVALKTFMVVPAVASPVPIDISPKPVESSAQIVLVYALLK